MLLLLISVTGGTTEPRATNLFTPAAPAASPAPAAAAPPPPFAPSAPDAPPSYEEAMALLNTAPQVKTAQKHSFIWCLVGLGWLRA